MEQALHPVLACDPLQGLHHDLVVVHRNVGLRIDGSQLMLCRGHLIVLGLGGYAQLPQLLIDIPHICRNTLADGAEIMILHLLPLRRHGSEQGTACKDQILPL